MLERSKLLVIIPILFALYFSWLNRYFYFDDALIYARYIENFMNGYGLVYNKGECQSSYCPKKIYYRDREMKHLSYKINPQFYYFKISYLDKGKPLTYLLEKKLLLKRKKIENVTQLKNFLNKKKGVIHGLGCAEDLLPSFFKRRTLAECRPLGMIVDQYELNEKGIFVTTRLTVDDVHSPRSIHWGYLLSAVKVVF